MFKIDKYKPIIIIYSIIERNQNCHDTNSKKINLYKKMPQTIGGKMLK